MNFQINQEFLAAFAVSLGVCVSISFLLIFLDPVRVWTDNMRLKEMVGKRFPRILSIWRIVRISRGKFSFSGWGMYTDTFTSPPWASLIEGAEVDSAVGFKQTNEFLKSLVDDKGFNLTQFAHLEKQSLALDVLAWRHYIVYWSALSASKATQSGKKNLVEVGTCDGLTAFFAMSALKNMGSDYKCYMYDAWEAMKADDLLENEKAKSGMYSYLNLETTIENLIDFAPMTVFNKGYIPKLFAVASNPDEVIWLHIDLNAASPTRDSLLEFFHRMLPGGIILFDDYASHDHVETKRVVDEFFNGKNVNLLQLPTGQALVFIL
jgi:O-methyltransferase